MADGRRVLLAFHEEALGGAILALLHVLPLLEARGWVFEFWAPTGGALEQLLVSQGRAVTGMPRDLRLSRAALREPPGARARLRSGARYLLALRQLVRGGNFDLVHANSLVVLPEAIVAGAAHVPVVLHVHEMLPAGPRGAVAGRLARRANAVVAVSGAAARALAAQGVTARIVHNGIPLMPAPPARDAGSTLVVGTVGTVSSRKGTDLFLAAADLLDDLPLELRIVGPHARGPEAAWAAAVADRARRAGIAVYPSQDVAAELAGWDVFVLPSREEAFGLVVLEAMAAGLPVVASRVGGIPELLGEEVGILVEPGDLGALERAVRRLANDPELRERMGAAGRARVETEFTLDRQAEGLDRAYRDALRVMRL